MPMEDDSAIETPYDRQNKPVPDYRTPFYRPRNIIKHRLGELASKTDRLKEISRNKNSLSKGILPNLLQRFR
nr:hypothetical protein [uncultured bacterium]